jgi:four helix bundle protein
MATISKFEDLQVWQKARELTVAIYNDHRQCRDFGFRDQIQRASVSIMNNIAEGFDRKGDKEFAHFLYIAKGSCAEVRSMLHLAAELTYSSKERSDELVSQTEEISRMLGGLIRSLHHSKQ